MRKSVLSIPIYASSEAAIARSWIGWIGTWIMLVLVQLGHGTGVAEAKTVSQCLKDYGASLKNCKHYGDFNNCSDKAQRWSRLSEQNLRVDKWSVCRV